METRWLSKCTMRMQMLFRRGAAAAHLDDELRFHLERQVAENIDAGMTGKEARYAALQSFGNPELLRDQARATWSWNGLESLWRDLRFGVRTLWRTPGFTAIAVLVMALGIGANVALFTVVRGVLLRPLPFKAPERLVRLFEQSSDGVFLFNNNAGGMYAEWKKQSHSFSNLALFHYNQSALSGVNGSLPENLASAACTWDLLTTLGVKPALGRDFTAADDSPTANGTVILSWGLWQRRFGGDPAILNQTIDLDAKPYTVIGVMPAWFAFPEPGTQLWTPAYHDIPDKRITMLDNHSFQVVGRLKPGVTATQATEELSLITKRIHDAHRDLPFVSVGARSRPLLDWMVGNIRKPLYVLLAATGCVLLIACLNVANLLVARAAARRREMAIRTALGGGWLRLLRERLIESLLLSAAGGVLGLTLAYGAVAWLLHARKDMSRVDSIHVDAVVAAFTVAVVVLCALASGLISAFSAGDKRILGALHESSRSSSGSARATLRRVLLSLEVGLTVILLIGAGLLLKSYERLRSADMGCVTDNVLTMRIGLPEARYKTKAMVANFYDTLLERVRALPGVDAAGLVEVVPGQGYWEDSGFTVVEHPPLPQGNGLFAMNRTADPRYFGTMGIPILHGRTFGDNQRLDQANEVIISQQFAQKYLPGEEPLGKHLRTYGREWVIVGIVGDTRFEIGESPRPTKYFPIDTGEQNANALVVRSSRDVEQQALPIQRVISEMDKDLPVSDVLTMNQVLGQSTIDQSFNTTLLVGFAALSMLLAAVGLFGVLSYIVAQRTSEIGIRIALGAQREQVLRLVLADGLRPAFIGLALGLGASASLVRLMKSMLYETQPLDPAVFATVAATLLAVAAVACMVPAWRASHLDPVQALRIE
jgi:putative ABC transport system permease protein